MLSLTGLNPPSDTVLKDGSNFEQKHGKHVATMLKLLQRRAMAESGALLRTPGHPIPLAASPCSKNIDSGFASLSSVSAG